MIPIWLVHHISYLIILKYCMKIEVSPLVWTTTCWRVNAVCSERRDVRDRHFYVTEAHHVAARSLNLSSQVLVLGWQMRQGERRSRSSSDTRCAVTTSCAKRLLTRRIGLSRRCVDSECSSQGWCDSLAIITWNSLPLAVRHRSPVPLALACCSLNAPVASSCS